MAAGQVRPPLVTNVVRLILLVVAVVVAGATFRTFGAVAGLSCVMGVVLGLLLERLDHWPSIVQLLTCTLAGAALYFALGRLIVRDVTAPTGSIRLDDCAERRSDGMNPDPGGGRNYGNCWWSERAAQPLSLVSGQTGPDNAGAT